MHTFSRVLLQKGMTTCRAPVKKYVGRNAGVFRRTSLLLFIGAQKRYSGREAIDFVSEVDFKNENIFSDGGLSGSIEWNLLGDPSGGLNEGESAEELSDVDLMNEITLRQQVYIPEQFYILFTPVIDIVQLLVDHDLLPDRESAKASEGAPRPVPGAASLIGRRGKGMAPRDPVSKVVSHWFVDGQTLLAKPTWMEERMGKERYRSLVDALCKMYEPMEAVMPLTRVVRRYNLPEEIFVPLLRQISLDMYSDERRAETVKVAPSLIITLANGRAPRELGMPEDDVKRVTLVTALFMAVAVETGNTDLAYLGIQLLRANGLPVPFTFQKQLTNVFSTASRVLTDWRVRSAGTIADCLGRWRTVYLRKAKLDVRTNYAQNQLLVPEADEEEDMGRPPDMEEKEQKKDEKPVGAELRAPSKRKSDSVSSYFATDYFSADGDRRLARELEEHIKANMADRVAFWREQRKSAARPGGVSPGLVALEEALKKKKEESLQKGEVDEDEEDEVLNELEDDEMDEE